MQRKPGFPVANCNIKMPDSIPPILEGINDDDLDQQRRRQQLINFAHSQWGFNNWSWTVSKQDLDFVDFSGGKYSAGVVAFVNITVKSFDIHRENIGYATCTANMKGSAIYQSRKCAVTNALRETLLSFGGTVAAELTELLESPKVDTNPPQSSEPENNQNAANVRPSEPKNTPRKNDPRKSEPANSVRVPSVPPVVKNVPVPPVPSVPPANRPVPRAAPPPARSNVSFVLQPVMPPMYGPPRVPPVPHVHPHVHHPPVYPNYYDYSAPWYYDGHGHHANVNLNFNMPPKNLVVNGRGECKRPAEGEPLQYSGQGQGCWIKPTIFYDGFWTEQKVKKWVAEQVEKQFPDEANKVPSSGSSDVPHK